MPTPPLSKPTLNVNQDPKANPRPLPVPPPSPTPGHVPRTLENTRDLGTGGTLDLRRTVDATPDIDIGVHLGKPLPDGSGTWTAEYAFDFMGRNVNMSPEFVRFEVNRYLGWPGQAPSYKIGQRIWEQLRDDAARRAGDAFDIKDFHDVVLGGGSVPMTQLEDIVTRWLAA